MSGLHTWAGLLLGWLLYAMFLTGTVSYFKEELSQWMRPELPRLAQLPDPAVVAQRVADEIGMLAPGTAQWSLRLPDTRNNAVNAFWRTSARGPGQRGFEEARFDPVTGHKVVSRDTLGGEVFYRFHFQFYYMPVVWGRWLAGIAAMFMLVAIVAGVITHKKIFTDFFTFRWGRGQRSWLDAHNALSVFGLPFHIMITYTGLVTLMALYMPWGERAAFKTPAERQQLAAELSAFSQPGKPSGDKLPLASVEEMVRQAQARWGRDNVGRVNANNPGDATARIAVTRGDDARVSMSPQYMEFDGATGKLLAVHDGVGAAAETRGVLYALHLGRFSDVTTRWLYFLVSLMGTAMVGTGLVMWTVKRRAKLADPARPHLGFRLVERLNIASIAGLSIAMTAFLWGNRLLPLTLENRAYAEIDLFFTVWALTLLHALLRPAKAAWVEQLWAAAALLALLPVLNALTTQRPLWHSLATGDWVFAGVDLMCWALAALHGVLALRTARHGVGFGRTTRPRNAEPRSDDRGAAAAAATGEAAR
ncbi:MAG: PepSY domain-containing protein [Rhodopseudomonas palustris]|uniref:PepSY domain-containing protein n=1 Tax=Rhodopseudomonas palustris TaxID=1076 RepID=A0A933W2M0_RHOPL|nr:PepSY domain-containing protein [Rhodopseudomonas palustris]